MTDKVMLRYRKLIEADLRREWRGSHPEFWYDSFHLRLSGEDFFPPAVTEQNIKKMAKRIAIFEELVYGQ